MSRLISAVIATHDDEALLPATLQGLQALKAESNLEIVVCDGGSRDQSLKIAEKYARIVISQKSLALQNNAGAETSLGDILFFCRPGMQFAPGTLYEIKKRIIEQEMDGGGFSTVYAQHDQKIRRWGRILNLELKNSNREGNLRFFWDNGIFVRRRVFEALSGFKTLATSADSDFSDRLRKNYKASRIAQPKLILSSSKFEQEGIFLSQLKQMLHRRLHQLGLRF